RKAHPAHQPVVGVHRDPERQLAQQPDRVRLDRRGGAGLHVRRRAHLQRDPAVPDVAGQPAQRRRALRGDLDVVPDADTVAAPPPWSASQMEGSPNPSPAWIVMWKFSRATYWNASRCRLGGLPASAPAMSNPATPRSRYRTASSAISSDRAAVRIAVSSAYIVMPRPSLPSRNPPRTASRP